MLLNRASKNVAAPCISVPATWLARRSLTEPVQVAGTTPPVQRPADRLLPAPSGQKALPVFVQLRVVATWPPAGEHLFHGLDLERQEISERLEVRCRDTIAPTFDHGSPNRRAAYRSRREQLSTVECQDAPSMPIDLTLPSGLAKAVTPTTR